MRARQKWAVNHTARVYTHTHTYGLEIWRALWKRAATGQTRRDKSAPCCVTSLKNSRQWTGENRKRRYRCKHHSFGDLWGIGPTPGLFLLLYRYIIYTCMYRYLASCAGHDSTKQKRRRRKGRLVNQLPKQLYMRTHWGRIKMRLRCNGKTTFYKNL
jgi:hypothetical protein